MNALREALLRGKRRPRRAGAGSPTLYRGDGYEFVELREYVAGDDVRRIDWAATARTRSLQTRVMLEETSLTLAAIVDTSASMRSGRSRALAQSAAEIVEAWFGAAASGDRCARVDCDDVVAPWSPRSSGSFSLGAAFEVAAAALPRGTALLAVSDCYDLPDDDELLCLLGSRLDCTALIARDPWADGLPLSGFVRVEDAEDGRASSLFIGRAERIRYARAVRRREDRLAERFSQANWRTEFFSEGDGTAALLRAFGFR